MSQGKKISWTAADHIKYEKSSDWFWIAGILGIGSAGLSIYFGNLLFALIILLGIFLIFIQSSIQPKQVNFEINRKGVVVGSILYPYSTLESYWVIDEDGWDRDRLLLKSKKVLMPLIVVPLGENSDPEEISDYLLEYLNEEQMEDSPLNKISILLGL